MHGFLLSPALSSHKGLKRKRNEDAIGYNYPDTLPILHNYGAMFILADGVAGLHDGEQASDLAIRSLLQTYYQAAISTVEAQLVTSIQTVNSHVFTKLDRSATTLVAAAFYGNHVTIASVGDSPAFWIDAKGIQKLTTDHIVVPDMQQPTKTRLTRAVGYQETVLVDTVTGELATGGKLLMVSDGVTRYLNENRLFQVVAANTPAESVRILIEESNAAGGADNISVVVVEVGQPYDHISELNQHLSVLGRPYIEVVYPPVAPPPIVAPPPPVYIPPAPPALLAQPALTVADYIPPAPTSFDPVPPATTGGRLNLGRLVLILLLLAVILAGVGGIIYLLTQDPFAETPSETPTLTPTATFTLTPIPTVEEQTPTLAPTVEPTVEPSELPPTLAAPATALLAGQTVQFSESTLTYRSIGGDGPTAFPLVAAQVYTIQDVYVDTRQDEIWYQLYDEERKQNGWINEADLPEYEIVEP